MYSSFAFIFYAPLIQVVFAGSYAIPPSPPSNSSVQLATNPIGVSLEFFAFPEYMHDVPSTQACLKNLANLTGAWPPLRVGGTTQDRATYDASSPNDVTYTVANSTDAPTSLTFGPSFMALAGTYNGSVILGLNRRLDNITNTIAAAKEAMKEMDNLDAIELGNEPNFYVSSDPIANGSWNATKDYASEVSWQASVGSNLTTTNIFSAGVIFGTSPFNIAGLASVEGNAIDFVKDFCSHNYPQSATTANLSALMSHSGIATEISQFKSEIAAAQSKGKPHIMGETNSATGGGGGISPTYGAALWVMDYSLQLLLLGSRSLYFHQGTIGNCQYCWWGVYDVGAPYYGAYFATMALANSDSFAALDTMSSPYGVYAFYQDSKPTKVLLYNSDYYTSGTRSMHTFTLTHLPGSQVVAYRLTAPAATSRQDQGQNPTIAGQTFANGTCEIEGIAQPETVVVSGRRARFTVAASEALLIYL